ncbi:restriction endonuclease subunit S [bacterium]|nr:restriction endonuclease subunit S [bacterium]MBU1634144.1 restriction endonuclease subunit S [bacterium]MBU1875413.1 restriction endonuclease subunit S [bacterium]
MSDWKKYKLGELGSFFGGVTSIKREDYGYGTPFLPYKNVYKNSKVNINGLELMNVSQKDIERRAGIYGDIFFTASSETPDEVAMSSVLLDEIPNLTYNGFCKRLRLNNFNTLSPIFARYLFRDNSFRNEVYQLINGDIRFNISQESLASIEITIPDLPTQTKIASILSSLDDKIELNLQMNKTLEAIAQTIFKEWFVNFNFPSFDGELVDGLPKGWKRGKLGDEFNLTMGQSPPGQSYNEVKEGTIFYQGRTDFGFRFPANRIYTTSPNRIAEKFDTLVTVRAPVGDINMAIEQCCIGRGLSAVRHKTGAYSFTYYAMKNIENIFKGFESNGTVFGSLNKANYKNIEIIIPSNGVIELFEQITNPIDEKFLDNFLENQTLSQLRDSLLPKLMTGKIEINV